MSQRRRQRAILEIVQERPIHSQTELVTALERRGYRATQATVSRDIRQLGLLKLSVAGGRSRYVVAEDVPPAGSAGLAGLRQACRQFVTEVGDVQSLIVLRTRAGRANAVAVAIDEAGLEEVAGTLAGDDTILVLLQRAADREALLLRFRDLID